MTRVEFDRQLSMWLTGFTTAAAQLFNDGVAPERILPIATQIADAKLVERNRNEQALGGPIVMAPSKPRGVS
jgi:hypothetical protein